MTTTKNISSPTGEKKTGNESQEKQKSEEKSGQTAMERLLAHPNLVKKDHPGGVKVYIRIPRRK